MPARCTHHRPGLCGGHGSSSISENRLSHRASLMNATRIPPQVMRVFPITSIHYRLLSSDMRNQETLESPLRVLVRTFVRFNLTLSDHTAHETPKRESETSPRPHPYSRGSLSNRSGQRSKYQITQVVSLVNLNPGELEERATESARIVVDKVDTRPGAPGRRIDVPGPVST